MSMISNMLAPVCPSPFRHRNLRNRRVTMPTVRPTRAILQAASRRCRKHARRQRKRFRRSGEHARRRRERPKTKTAPQDEETATEDAERTSTNHIERHRFTRLRPFLFEATSSSSFLPNDRNILDHVVFCAGLLPIPPTATPMPRRAPFG